MTRANDPLVTSEADEPFDDADHRDTPHDTIIPAFDVTKFAAESDSKVRTVPAPPAAGELTLDRVRALFEVGGYEEALTLAEAALIAVPLHAETSAWAAKCRDSLERAYLSNIGSLASIPELVVSMQELHTFGLDHAAGFVIAQIDGATSVETLLDICGMPRRATLRVLSDLASRGIISFVGPSEIRRRF